MVTKISIPGLSNSPRTTQASVSEHLRRMILSGQLPPGTRLVQAELAESLKLSVTPIREALRELSGQGLVDLDAFRGGVVHTPTLAELEEIFEIRSALIPLSVRKGLERVTPSQLDIAETLLGRMEQESDRAVWINLNRDFHAILYAMEPSFHLQDVLQRLSDIATIYINLSFQQEPAQRLSAEAEHRLLLTAYRNKDLNQAIELMLEHINSTLQSARLVLEQSQ